MLQESSQHLMKAASFAQEFGESFVGIQFDERLQAIEVFVLQAISMCSSHCHAASLLLHSGFKGETVTVLRAVQELFFNLHWILQATDRGDRLERVYQLEADPYAHWEKELRIIERELSPEIAKRFRGPLDDIASHYNFLTEVNADGRVVFKTAPHFAARMVPIRPRFYHVYCFSSLFSHPTPTVKRLYLKTDDPEGAASAAIDESLRQFVAYTLLFIELTLNYAEETIGSFASTRRARRDALYSDMIDLVKRANKGYFPNPGENESSDERLS